MAPFNTHPPSTLTAMRSSQFLVLLPLLKHAYSFDPLHLSTVKNFRPVFPNDPSGRFFRAAAFEDLSEEDGQLLLNQLGSDNLTMIDLRNQDEIDKQFAKKSEASIAFYKTIPLHNQHHVPILKNVNAFWDEAIDRMDGPTKIKATLATITQAGALDRAAARLLEDKGLSMLYTIMLATSSAPLRRTLSICANAPGPVVFHCQKGKDRTGVVAMLLQSCRGIKENEIIEQYALSGDLLGESPGSPSSSDEKKTSTLSSTMLDWSKFRGSPAFAMEETLEWIRQRHGSVVDGYLVSNLQIDTATLDKLSKG